jgi:hypothetical protein
MKKHLLKGMDTKADAHNERVEAKEEADLKGIKVLLGLKILE